MSAGTSIAMLVIIVIMVAIVIAKMSSKREERAYDERQRSIVARGFRLTTLVLVTALVAGAYLVDSWTDAPFTPGFLMLAIMCAGIMVDCLYCMARGAYFGLVESARRRRTILAWLAIGVLGIVTGVASIMGQAPGAQLGVQNAPLLLGIVFVILPLAALVCGDPEVRGDEE